MRLSNLDSYENRSLLCPLGIELRYTDGIASEYNRTYLFLCRIRAGKFRPLLKRVHEFRDRKNAGPHKQYVSCLHARRRMTTKTGESKARDFCKFDIGIHR